MAKRKRHSRRRSRALSNPFSASSLLSTPKEMVSTQFVMEAAGVAAGFVLPNMVMNYIPATWRSTTLTYYASKVATVAVLAAAGRMVSPRVARFVMVGGGVSLLLDLYTEVMSGHSPAPTAPASGTPAATTGTGAFYGDTLSAWYGTSMGDWDVP